MRERITCWHQSSRNLPAQVADWYSQNCWKSSLSRVGSCRLEIVAQQLAQPEALLPRKVGLALEHTPTGPFQDWLITILGQPASFASAHFIERLVHLGDDVEAIENVHRIAATLADDAQIRLPHIRAHVFDFLRQGRADQGEELLEALDRAFFANPEQPRAFLLDLVDQRQILVAFAILDLIHTDGEDRAHAAMRQTPFHYVPAWRTLSQELRKDAAVSCQDSFLAQCAKNSM